MVKLRTDEVVQHNQAAQLPSIKPRNRGKKLTLILLIILLILGLYTKFILAFIFLLIMISTFYSILAQARVEKPKEVIDRKSGMDFDSVQDFVEKLEVREGLENSKENLINVLKSFKNKL